VTLAKFHLALAALVTAGLLGGCMATAKPPPDDTPLAVRAIGPLRLSSTEEARMLLVMSAGMVKIGSLSSLQDGARTADHIAGLYARTQDHKGVFVARMLQADALIQLDRLDEAETALSQGEAAAQSAQCPACLSEFHTRRAQLAMHRRAWDRAEADFDTAVAILEPRGDRLQQARIRLYQSGLALKAQQLAVAEDAALQAEAHAARIVDARLTGTVHAQLSEVLFQRQDFAAAADRMERAQLAFADAGANTERVSALCRLGRLGFATRDPQKARQRIAEAVTVATRESGPGPRARQWLLIADAYARLGDREAAGTGFEVAAGVYRDAGSAEGLAAVEVLQIMNGLTDRNAEDVSRRVAVARGHLATKPAAGQAKRVDVSPLPLTRWQIDTSLDVAEGFLLFRQLKLEEALKRFENAAKLARSWNQPHLLGSSASLQGDVLVLMSRHREAEQAYAVALEAYERQGDVKAAEQTRVTLDRVRARISMGS